MRTYFIIAALMGVFAFGSISLLAHAQEGTSSNRVVTPLQEREAAQQQQAVESEPEVAEEPADTGPSKEEMTRDKAACREKAYGRRRIGAPDKRTQDERDMEFQDCMSNLGYTVDEINDEPAQ